MKLFALGVIAAIVVAMVAVYVAVATGSVPVETSAHPLPFEKTLATMDLNRRARKNMPRHIPIQASQDNLVAGGKVYIQHCSVCHGLLGEPRPEIARAMFPPPPELYKTEEGVTNDPPPATYWKIKNGIRLSGMPAFQRILSDAELWQVTLFLASTDNAAILEQLEKQQKTVPADSSGAAASHPAAVVRMEDDVLAFNPATVTIKVGQMVEWKNSSREVHTVTGDPREAVNLRDVELPKGAQPFDSGFLQPGQTYSHAFGTPGTYRYVCTPHEVQNMKGQVIVKP